MTLPEPQFATRLNSFRKRAGTTASAESALEAVAAVPGIDAVELNFPQHFPADDPARLLRSARSYGLAVTALNMRFDDPRFALGAFTNPHEADRRAAIDLCHAAVDLAAANGIGHVIVWPGPDGFDAPFQARYDELWDFEVDGFRRVTRRNPQVRVSIEYKPSDPRRQSLVRSMADALLLVQEVGEPNLGVTLDFCHALMAGEHPPAAAAMALRAGRLFGVHLNDGYGPADDGLPVGSIHLWPTVELLLALRRHRFGGTIYFDTFPERTDPAAECAANVRSVLGMLTAVDRMDGEELQRLQAEQRSIEAWELARHAVVGDVAG